MRSFAFAAVVALAASIAFAADAPYLVKDINISTAAGPHHSSPANFFKFGSRVVFTASSPFTGVELYMTDGTTAGTSIVMDINPGDRSSSPSNFAILNDRLIFSAVDELHGQELWTTDGTAAGTRLLADIYPGFGHSSPGDGIVYHGRLLFSAREPVNGRELWITDGTPAGTRFFKDLVPGAADSSPQSFVLLNDTVYFVAGTNLWKTDGTESGTFVVKTGSSQPQSLVATGSFIFFGAYSPVTGIEPWVSDGTEAGTHMLLEINPGPESSTAFTLPKVFGNRVIFAATDPQHGVELWITDGTTAGTLMIRDIAPGPSGSRISNLSVGILSDMALFSAITLGTGDELWKTDGTEAGTVLVRDLNPGEQGSGPRDFMTAGGKVYFVAFVNGVTAIWVTDGTAAGTHPLKTTAPFPILDKTASSILTSIDDVLYFAAANALNGFEPWKSDGSDSGTAMIKNIAEDAAPSSVPSNLTAAADWVYFDAWDGMPAPAGVVVGERSLWRSDGTPEGTLKIADAPFDLNRLYVAFGRSAFFWRNDVLWLSDGTPEGTLPAYGFTNRFPAPASISFVAGDTLFFSVATSGSNELWTTTTAPGSPALSLGVPAGFHVEFAGRVLIFASTSSGPGIWSTDGTPSGTYLVAQIAPGSITTAVASGGAVYFVAHPSEGGAQLWRTDGTFDGTVALRSVTGDTLIPAGRNLFIGESNQLSVTDGTPAGSRTLPGTFALRGGAAIGERIVYAATDATNGMELWVSDGTADGTNLLRDIYPGTRSSGPGGFLAADGRVYFFATDDQHGTEPWVTDGTAEGTKLVADIEPGLASTFLQQFTRAGGRLFFPASTSATGNELWAFDLPSTQSLSVGDVRVAENNSGTTSARFTVSLSGQNGRPVTVDYATADGTAVAGTDYTTTSGTLTFAPGEASKIIEVPVRGDVEAETNESFFVVLRNPSGATLVRPVGTGIIEDDDQSADVALIVDFSRLTEAEIGVKAGNSGPSVATGVKTQSTSTPADIGGNGGLFCPPQILAGATACFSSFRSVSEQLYRTVTVTARQRDPQRSNNTASWTQRLNVAMDALNLSPGSQANGWFAPFTPATSVNLASSDSTIVSVPSTLDVTAPAKVASFPIRALRVGTATIRVFTPTAQNLGTLVVDVVEPGTKQRWPGAISVLSSEGTFAFDRPMLFRITAAATAPFTGEAPTGVVRITDAGRELGRITLNGSTSVLTLTVNVPDVGKHTIAAEYGGDQNFLPSTQTFNVTTTQGSVTLSTSAVRHEGTAAVHVRVTGSPASNPTGTITVSEPGVISATQPLTPLSNGVSQADFMLNNVSSGPHTLVILYSGDTHYYPTTQNAPLMDGRRRAVKP
ncbi:MAG TPA: Ig-like domain repeat protein [Thermoanaerobaculia bacterium]|nr:Ig-like domain repeat protein [Thermoanaerobaculia bacterium]